MYMRSTSNPRSQNLPSRCGFCPEGRGANDRYQAGNIPRAHQGRNLQSTNRNQTVCSPPIAVSPSRPIRFGRPGKSVPATCQNLRAATSSSLATRNRALFILGAASAIPTAHIASYLMLGVSTITRWVSKLRAIGAEQFPSPVSRARVSSDKLAGNRPEEGDANRGRGYITVDDKANRTHRGLLLAEGKS